MPKDTILGLCDLKVAQRESKQTIAPSGSRYRHAARWEAGGAAAPPDFGGSINPISTREDTLSPPSTTCPPDFWPLVHPWLIKWGSQIQLRIQSFFCQLFCNVILANVFTKVISECLWWSIDPRTNQDYLYVLHEQFLKQNRNLKDYWEKKIEEFSDLSTANMCYWRGVA